MDAATIIRSLDVLDFRIRIDGDSLVVEPGSRLTEQLAKEIKAHKSSIIALLTPARWSTAAGYKQAFLDEHDAFVCPHCFEPVLLEEMEEGRKRYTDWFDGRPHSQTCGRPSR